MKAKLKPVWRVASAYFVEREDVASQECTLEIDHGNGESTFIVVPIIRQSDRVSNRKQESSR